MLTEVERTYYRVVIESSDTWMIFKTNFPSAFVRLKSHLKLEFKGTAAEDNMQSCSHTR